MAQNIPIILEQDPFILISDFLGLKDKRLGEGGTQTFVFFIIAETHMECNS
jgi:hypothetical protein